MRRGLIFATAIAAVALVAIAAAYGQAGEAADLGKAVVETGGLWGIAAVFVLILAGIGAWWSIQRAKIASAERNKEREEIVTLTVTAVTATEKNTEKVNELRQLIEQRSGQHAQEHANILQAIHTTRAS